MESSGRCVGWSLLTLLCAFSLACDSDVRAPTAPQPEPAQTTPSSGFAVPPYDALPDPRLFARGLRLSDDKTLFGESDCVLGLNGEWNDRKSRCTLSEDLVGGVHLGPRVELNCDGHSILGDGGGIGVRADDDSRVKNCTIRASDPAAPLGAGIFVDGVTGFRCEQCKIDQAEFSLFSVDGVGNSFFRCDISSPFVDILGEDNSYEWIKFLPPSPFPFPFPDYAGLFVGSLGVNVANSEFPGSKEWGLVVIDPVDFIAGHNWFEGGFGGVILDGSGGNVLVAGNRFSNMDLPVQIAVDGHGFLVLGNEFMNTGGSQIGTFPGQTSSGHYYMFNSFHNGRDTDNDFRDMGAVFDGLEDLIFGFNTVRGAVNNGVLANGFLLPRPVPPPSLDPLIPSDRALHILFNSIRDNGGHGISVQSEAEKSAWIWLNELEGNNGFQVHILEPWEYGAPFEDGFIGNWYGSQGFLPGITSNATDICPLPHPVPRDPLRVQVFNSLKPFLGEPFPGMLEVIESWQLDQPDQIDDPFIPAGFGGLLFLECEKR
jgi:hypothetical protein